MTFHLLILFWVLFFCFSTNNLHLLLQMQGVAWLLLFDEVFNFQFIFDYLIFVFIA